MLSPGRCESKERWRLDGFSNVSTPEAETSSDESVMSVSWRCWVDEQICMCCIWMHLAQEPAQPKNDETCQGTKISCNETTLCTVYIIVD